MEKKKPQIVIFTPIFNAKQSEERKRKRCAGVQEAEVEELEFSGH